MSFLKGLFSLKNNSENEKRFKKLYEIDDKDRIQFYQYLYKVQYKEVVDFIEKFEIDVDGYSKLTYSTTILIDAICSCSSDFYGTDGQIKIVNYLINKGVDINLKTSQGYNALEVALAQHSLSKIALILIKTGKADVNSVDKHGSNPIFTAIREYSLSWREEQRKVNQLRYEIVEELLNRGADLDLINNHGISSRRWLEGLHKNDSLHDLISSFDKK